MWPRVFVNCCRSWHIPVHARVHSLTLRCVESERWCWQTAEHLVSKWSPWPPLCATVSAWSKLFLIWTGIMYSQSCEVPLVPRSRDKNKYGNHGRWHFGHCRGKWQQVSWSVAPTSQNLLSGLKCVCWQLRKQFFFNWRTQLPEESAFDCSDFKKIHCCLFEGN